MTEPAADPQAPAPLDLSSLRAALRSFTHALDVLSSPEFAQVDERWRDTLVAGVVQHFEFTFELCWKMLKRQLERELPSPLELDALGYRPLFRLGAQRGLVASAEPWFEFRELRNITSHSYARETALKIAAQAPALRAHAIALLTALEARNLG